MKNVITVFSAWFLMSLAIMQAAFGDFSRYDADSDGALAPEEFADFYREAKAPSILTFDLDADGRLNSEEMNALTMKVRQLHAQAKHRAKEYAQGDTKDVQDAGRAMKILAGNRFGILIRESHYAVDLQNPEASLAGLGAANLSMTQDLASDSRVISVKGAVLRPFSFGSMSGSWLLPGVQLNRLTNETDPEREIDSLTFRIGSEFLLETPKFGGGALFLRVNPLLTTNFGFDVDVRALELQLEPSWGAAALGRIRNLEWFDVSWRLLFQSEYGEVVDAGNRLDLRAGDSFARAGAKMSLKLKPKGSALFNGLVGVIDYEWHQDLAGDLRARRLFVAGLSYSLEELGHFTLETKYIRGDSSVALENEETWTIGLGVKL